MGLAYGIEPSERTLTNTEYTLHIHEHMIIYDIAAAVTVK